MNRNPAPAHPDSATEGGSRLQAAVGPLLLILGWAICSWGIWNARVGFGEDTGPLIAAMRATVEHTYPGNLYTLAYTLLLRFVTADPLAAALAMRAAVSLFTTLALLYVLAAFHAYFRRSAVLLACAVWLVSHCNTPIVQASNLSPFSFGIAALGLGWLLRRRSWSGFAGFALAIAVAAKLRPEYAEPALLIGGVVAVTLLWHSAQGRMRPAIFWSLCAALPLLAAVLIAPTFRAGSAMDRYLLLGLGQCYATFYKTEHPEAVFQPMTEYQQLLDATFDHPDSFSAALRHNPREAFRYFALNTLTNLSRLLPTMLSTRDTRVPASLLTGRRIHVLLLMGTLLAGGMLLARRIVMEVRSPVPQQWKEALRRARTEHGELMWKLLLVVLFASASSVAIILLVPVARYWITCAPLLFLTVAACFDSLLRLRFLENRSWLLCAPALALLCRPLFLGMGPNENYEVHALRSIVPLLAERPVLAGIWTEPFQAYAFRGKAIAVNAWDDLSAAGVKNGRYDVLIVDPLLRSSRAWQENQSAFEEFEADPGRHGYAKVTGSFTGPNSIYYRLPVNRE